MEKIINHTISPPFSALSPLISHSSSPVSLSFKNPSCNFQSSHSRNPFLFFRRLCRTSSSTHLKQLSCIKASTVELKPSLFLKNKAVDISYELKGTSIFLVGISGAMKTSIGELLADALKYYYFDSDGLVEQAAGSDSAAKSFRETDEEGFRDSETEVFRQLSSMGRLVVCAGDGAVQTSTNLSLLRYGISLWIDIPLDILAKEATESRGLCPSSWGIASSDIYSEVLTKLTKLYEGMRGGYATADATVSLQKVASRLEYDDLEAVTPEDMAVEALKEIEKLTRVKKMMEEAGRPF